LHETNFFELAADADASLHDSRKHVMYDRNADNGAFPKLFSQLQSQASYNVGDTFLKSNFRMNAGDAN